MRSEQDRAVKAAEKAKTSVANQLNFGANVVKFEPPKNQGGWGWARIGWTKDIFLRYNISIQYLANTLVTKLMRYYKYWLIEDTKFELLSIR